MSHEIEKNILIPPLRTRTQYPFADMEIGDSFFITDARMMSNVRSSASRWGIKHNTKFSVKVMENGMRIWRIE